MDGRFATTRWSMVLAAGHGDATEARSSLAELCQAYWVSLYAYVRRRGYSPEDAQDLTQAFFARLLEKNWVAAADQTKGRFRSFLLSAMKHFLADEWDRTRAQKRGGGIATLPLEFDAAEERYVRELADAATPERLYERSWAIALLNRVLQRLQTDYAKHGKAALFDALHPCLVGERTEQPYAELADMLGLTEAAVKSAVHRLRGRYRQLLREEIAGTLDDAALVDDELSHLFRVLGA